jgi:hypothetical protein
VRTASTLATLSFLWLSATLIAPAISATWGPTFQPVPFSDGPPEFPDTAGYAHIGDGVSDGQDKDRLIRKVFGDTRYSMVSCTNTWRSVRIDAQRVNKEFDVSYGGNIEGVAREAVRRAILFSWKNCPPDPSLADPYLVNQATVFLPGGEEIYIATNLKATLGPGGNIKQYARQKIYARYGWQTFHDLRALKLAERLQREREEWWTTFWLSLKVLFWLILCGTALGFALWNWEAFVRFYYQLTPHPAASMVKDAIRARVEFDAQAFADIVREPPGSRVGRDVRNEQAAKLAAMARMSNEQLRRMAEELRQQFEDQAKYQAATGESLDAVAERLAKARADAYAKAEEFWKSRRKT